MSGGGGGGSDDGVQYQREQEEARQARIREGMTRIDELFNGKDVPATYGTRYGERVAFDPYWGTAPGTYYDNTGRQLTFTSQNQARKKHGGIDVRTPRPTHSLRGELDLGATALRGVLLAGGEPCG